MPFDWFANAEQTFYLTIEPSSCSASPPCSHSVSYDPPELEKLVLYSFLLYLFCPFLENFVLGFAVSAFPGSGLNYGWHLSRSQSAWVLWLDMFTMQLFSILENLLIECYSLKMGSFFNIMSLCGLCFLTGGLIWICFRVRVTSQLVWNEFLSHLGYSLYLSLDFLSNE